MRWWYTRVFIGTTLVTTLFGKSIALSKEVVLFRYPTKCMILFDWSSWETYLHAYAFQLVLD